MSTVEPHREPVLDRSSPATCSDVPVPDDPQQTAKAGSRRAMLLAAAGGLAAALPPAKAQDRSYRPSMQADDVAFLAAQSGDKPGSVGSRLSDFVSPLDFGAKGDGTDDTSAIVAALAARPYLNLRNHYWKITSTIDLPAGCVIDMRNANIIAATGATPLFAFTNAKAGLLIHGGGTAVVSGTASALLYADGTSDKPTNPGHYARQIRLCDIQVSSPTITKFLDFQKAVRQVFVRGCQIFTQNGIDLNGKCVETYVSDTIIYGSTGVAGTYGLRTRSTGGTSFFNEGLHVCNSLVDNFEIAFDIADIFVFTVTGGYYGVNKTLKPTTGYTFKFQAPSTTTHTDSISIGGGLVISGRMIFVASASGHSYHADIDAAWVSTPGTAVTLESNASNITIRGKWFSGSGTAIGVAGISNNHGIVVSGDFDGTYVNGVILNGANGASCVIGPLSGPTTGDIIGLGRPIQLRGIPLHTAAVASLNRRFSPSNLAGSYAVGATISTMTLNFAKGETGDFVIHLPFSGANAATQTVKLQTAGVSLPFGTGWGMQNILLGAAGGLLSIRIPYHCLKDLVGEVVTVVNQAGNTLTVFGQAGFGVVRHI